MELSNLEEIASYEFAYFEYRVLRINVVILTLKTIEHKHVLVKTVETLYRVLQYLQKTMKKFHIASLMTLLNIKLEDNLI